MTNKREQLEKLSIVVADTGDLEAIRAYRPVDATTNPSLLLALAGNEQHESVLRDARKLAREITPEPDTADLCNAFATLTGQLVLEHIPGQVSTEVDARLSFDTAASIERARTLAALYRELGVDREQFLIKLAATWEGIRAAEVLEREGIRCNITLVFCLEQALAAAEAGATLVSPFVGRIHDWYLRQGHEISGPEDDPGVQSVREIYRTLKGLSMDTIVMGASFRTAAQVEALAGCDRLTISPKLLEQLEQEEGELMPALQEDEVEPLAEPAPLTEAQFRWALNENAMATELLADGIRRFARDQEALEELLG